MNKSNLMPKMVLGALVFSMAVSQVSANDGKNALERSGVEMPSFWSRVFGPSAAELAKQAEEATKKATEEATKKAAEAAAKAAKSYYPSWMFTRESLMARLPESVTSRLPEASWRNLGIAAGVTGLAGAGFVGYKVWKNKQNKAPQTDKEVVNKSETLLSLLSVDAGGKGQTAVFGSDNNNFDRWSTPAKFQYNVLSDKATLRLAKMYLSFICMMLDSVPGATVNDLPTLKNGANLKEQTEQALEAWDLTLKNIKGGWYIQPK